MSPKTTADRHPDRKGRSPVIAPARAARRKHIILGDLPAAVNFRLTFICLGLKAGGIDLRGTIGRWISSGNYKRRALKLMAEGSFRDGGISPPGEFGAQYLEFMHCNVIDFSRLGMWNAISGIGQTAKPVFFSSFLI